MRTWSPTAMYPRIRAAYKNAEEIAEVINASVPYVRMRLTGRGVFTNREKKNILKDLGEGPERMREYFPEEEA